MSATKLKVSNTWNANIKKQGGDRFSSVWKLTSALQTKGQNTWANPVVEFAGYTPSDLHTLLNDAYEEVVSQLGEQQAA